MLKITTLRELNGIRFLVEGKLASATIGVLEDCWREARRMRFPEIHVEFLDITYVDARGKELLKQMAMAGVNFSAKGVQMKSIVQEILEEAL